MRPEVMQALNEVLLYMVETNTRYETLAKDISDFFKELGVKSTHCSKLYLTVIMTCDCEDNRKLRDHLRKSVVAWDEAREKGGVSSQV